MIKQLEANNELLRQMIKANLELTRNNPTYGSDLRTNTLRFKIAIMINMDIIRSLKDGK